MSEFAKEITYKRIRGLIEEFIGGRREGITINHIKGQVASSINNHILGKEKIEEMLGKVEEEIKTNRLFPTLPSEVRLEKYQRLRVSLSAILA